MDKIRTRTSSEIQAQAVRALVGRLLPERAGEFEITIEPGLIGEENGYFEENNSNNKIHLEKRFLNTALF